MSIEYSGVNISGLEFGKGSRPGYDYHVPKASEFNYWAQEAGANIVRLPFRWERLQSESFGELNGKYLGHLQSAAASAAENGMALVLDMHNYANYLGEKLSTSDSNMLKMFSDVWSKLAVEFKSYDNVWFGLMNEPNGISASEWMEFAQEATNAIRLVGAENKIIVPTVGWSGAQNFNYSKYDDREAIYEKYEDPSDNFAWEVHLYLDSNYSGTSGDAVEGRGETALKGVTEWARGNSYEIFLGEFGVSDEGLNNLDESAEMLKYINDNPDVFLGWTAWGAGGWWPEHYHFNINKNDPANNFIKEYIELAQNPPIKSPPYEGSLSAKHPNEGYINLEEMNFHGYGGQDASTTDLDITEYSIYIEGNTWKSADLDYYITEHTYISFDFRSDRIGEIHAIGFETDNILSADRFIQVAGSQTFARMEETYSNVGDWQTFNISLGEFLAGDINSVVFVNDKDKGDRVAQSEFANVLIYENETTFPAYDSAVKIEISASDFSGYAGQDKSNLVFEAVGNAIKMSGNNWKILGVDYEFTENTYVSFDFRSDKLGELHGIGFENNDKLSEDRFLKIYGTQSYGIELDPYVNIGDWQSFNIKLGDYIDGDISHLVFGNDKDAGDREAHSEFANIVLYESDGLTPAAATGAASFEVDSSATLYFG